MVEPVSQILMNPPYSCLNPARIPALKEKEINKGGTAPWRPCDHLFVCLGEEEHD